MTNDKMPDVIYAWITPTPSGNLNIWSDKEPYDPFLQYDAAQFTRTDIHEAEVKRLRDALELARKAMINFDDAYCARWKYFKRTLPAIDAALDGK